MVGEERKFRSISEREAHVIWSLCKKKPSGRWSGITEAVRKIGEMRRGKSVSRQTVYDFLEAHPSPDEHPDYVGRRLPYRDTAKLWEDVPKPMIRPDEEEEEYRESWLLRVLDELRWRLWKDDAPLSRAGGHYSVKERRATFWIEWNNPTPYTRQVGRWGRIVFPDTDKKEDERVQLKRVEQDLEAVRVFFDILW